MKSTVLGRIRDLTHRIRHSTLITGRPKEFRVPYDKYRTMVASLRAKCETVAFTDRDPRANLILPDGKKNLYYIQFIMSGDAVEDTANGVLVLRSDILSQVRDEFERNEALSGYDKALAGQQELLTKKMFYVEQEITLPEFDFEGKSFALEFPGLMTNRSIALHDIQFIYDVNLKGFNPRFRFRFDDPEKARAWKQRVAGMRLGIVFHVVRTAENLWDTGMPGTLLYVVGFAFVQGEAGRVLPDLPVEVFDLRGPHDMQARNRVQISELVTRLLEKS